MNMMGDADTIWTDGTIGPKPNYLSPAACRSCGFTDCGNAGNALGYCPRWDVPDGQDTP